MSQTTRARVSEPAAAPPAHRSLLSAALLSAGWSFVVGLTLVGTLVLIGWATSVHQDTNAGQALRAAAQVWLACQHVPVTLAAGSISFLPLGLLVLPALLGHRTGRWAAAATALTDLRHAGMLTVGAGVTYGALSSVLAGLARTQVGAATPAQAFLGATGVGLLAIGSGVIRSAGLWPELLGRIPMGARLPLQEVALAVTVLVAAAAGLVAVAVAANAGSIMESMRSLGAAGPSGLLLVVLGLVYLPNAIIWALAYLCGPGFAIGSGTAVSPLVHTAGPLPDFPLFLAVPAHASGLARLLLAVPVLAGLLIAWRRRSAARGDRSLLHSLADSLAVAAGSGLVIALVTMQGAGALGSGYLARLGPDGVATGAAGAGLLLVGIWLGELASAAEREFARRRDG